MEKVRKRPDLHISTFSRRIRKIPRQMIVAFGQTSYYRPSDLKKNMICCSEIFNRIFCPIFCPIPLINHGKLIEAFLDFIVLAESKIKATKTLNLFREEGLVSEAYAHKFEKMLVLKNKHSKKVFIYFYRKNMCFRAITDWAIWQINQNMPSLMFNHSLLISFNAFKRPRTVLVTRNELTK